MVFDARGLMQVEGRLKADIRVTTLPDGLDPDEIALDDPERWNELVQQAKPVVIHVMETLASHADIDDPKTKEDIANQVLPLIEDVKGSVEREAYRQRLARLLKVDERALVRRSSGGTSRRQQRSYHQRPEVPAFSTPNISSANRQLEATCIEALISDPTLVHYIDRAFRGYELACLQEEDFSQTDFKELFKLAKESLDQDKEEPLAYVQSRIPEEIQETFLDSVEEIEYPDWRFQPNAPILEALLHTFVRLRRMRIVEGLDQIVFLQSQDVEESEGPPPDLNKIAMDYVQVRSKLDRALQQSNSQGKL